MREAIMFGTTRAFSEFPADDTDAAVDEPARRGLRLQRYGHLQET
ncbi:hypothetical protein [Streptomyces sp. NPDC007984]